MSKRKGFFREIRDEPKSTVRLVYFAFLLGVILLWVYTAIPEQEKNAVIYMFMLIAWVVATYADVTFAFLGKENLKQINNMGKKPLQAMAYGVAAIILISFIVPQALIEPLSVIAPPTLSFLFIVVAAPMVEALFFRGTLQPVIKELMQFYLIKDDFFAGVVAVVIQSFAFAWFHINIFGAVGNWFPYFVFGIIATIGVYFFRSLAFEFGLHGVNNYLAWAVMPK